MADYPGGCLCGAVRFLATNPELHFHACHCGMCRRWSGGPLFVAEVASVTFENSGNIGRFDSSSWAERAFCKTCGTNLYYRLKQADKFFVSVGSFDQASAFQLAGEIFIDHKPDGYAIAGEHPRLTEEETLKLFAGG